MYQRVGGQGQIIVQVAAGDTWDGATWGTTTVYVDSVTFSDGAYADYTFDADASALTVGTYEPIDGSTVDWQ